MEFSGRFAADFPAFVWCDAFFLIGTYYSINHYPLIQALDTTPVQVWLKNNLVRHFPLTWWVPVLLAILLLLGINTFSCACNRMTALWAKRHAMPGMVLFTPCVLQSYIACFFLYWWDTY